LARRRERNRRSHAAQRHQLLRRHQAVLDQNLTCRRRLSRYRRVVIADGSKDDDTRQAALMQGQSFLNAQPITIWLKGAGPQLAANAPPADNSTDGQVGPGAPAQTGVEFALGGNSGPHVPVVSKVKDPPPPVRDTSSTAPASLQASNQQVVDQIVKELESQAHFVSYAPPKLVAFRQGIYLELSLNSTLPVSAAGSRYKLAAMAFDDHISHLICPLLNYFKDEQKFDGIGFSTTVHLAGKSGEGTSEAVEFYFPLASLRCYEKLHRPATPGRRNCTN